MNDIKGSHCIEVIYFLEFEDSIDNIKLNPEDHSEYLWIAEEEIYNVIIQEKRNEEDPEIRSIKKDFSLLKEEWLSFY